MRNVADYRMPTVEEVLGGETQGGVPRPKVSFRPSEAHLLEARRFSAAEIVAPSPMSRWQAVKTLIRIVIMGDRS